jgi:hypothetical protein
MLFGENDYAGSIINLKEDGTININKYVNEISIYITDKNYYNRKIIEIDNALKKFSMKEVAYKYIELFD